MKFIFPAPNYAKFDDIFACGKWNRSFEKAFGKFWELAFTWEYRSNT